MVHTNDGIYRSERLSMSDLSVNVGECIDLRDRQVDGEIREPWCSGSNEDNVGGKTHKEQGAIEAMSTLLFHADY